MSQPSFYADEKFGDVVAILNARGWRPCAPDDSSATLLWRNLVSTPFDKIRSQTLRRNGLQWFTIFAIDSRPGTIVNHLKGAQALSNKGLSYAHPHRSELLVDKSPTFISGKLTRVLAARHGGRGEAFFPRSHALAPIPGVPAKGLAADAALAAAVRPQVFGP